MRRSVFPLVLLVLLAPPLVAQGGGDVEQLGRLLSGTRPPASYYRLLAENPGAFEFSQDNGWIRRARAVALRRAGARSAAVRTGTDLAAAHVANGVMQGDLNVPVLLVLYANSDSAGVAATAPRATMAQRIFGTGAAPPYSVYSYYREISNDNLNVNGTVREWVRTAQNDTFYEGGCNGLCGTGRVGDLIREAVQANDGTLDYSQFDNDGPDGVPNSPDDDGYVDALVIFHPEVDGACGTSNVWAHRFVYSGWTSQPLITNDVSNSGAVAFVRVRDYIIQGGQGGDGGCTPGAPQAMGVVAHELGHILGLPDLYDVSQVTEGIGEWGLMGSGNWRVPTRPAHMSAWSRAELGWVTEVLLDRDTTLAVRPVENSDTAFVVPVPQTNEYFLLENRQPLGSDANINGPGLLIWHVDSARIGQRRISNSVNASLPHGLALEQADGLNHLGANANRGDAGDPFPGTAGRTVFDDLTNPSAAANSGAESGVVIDQIASVMGGVIQLRVSGIVLVVAASDSAAMIRVDNVAWTRFRAGAAPPGTTYDLDVDAVQLAPTGRTRFTWQSWSNGQPRTHTIAAPATHTVITANVQREHLIRATATAGGSVTTSLAGDLDTGIFVAEGSGVTLHAVPEANYVFDGWSGETTGSDTALTLVATRPWDAVARFAERLVAASGETPAGVVGASFEHHLVATGGAGVRTWDRAAGSMPQGLGLTGAGVIVGVPEEAGSFAFTARVRSGAQSVLVPVALEVTAPAIAIDAVVRQLLAGTVELAPEHVRYLDLIGNRNDRFDVGDFLAWMQTTGGGASAAAIAAVLRAAREERP